MLVSLHPVLDLALIYAQRPAGQTASGRPERKRRAASYVGAEPSVEEVEAEFWRIVETPDDVYESLYGQVSSLHDCCPVASLLNRSILDLRQRL